MEAYVAVARLAQPTPGIAKKHASRMRQHNRYDRSRHATARMARNIYSRHMELEPAVRRGRQGSQPIPLDGSPRRPGFDPWTLIPVAADRLLSLTVKKYAPVAPKVAAWLEMNVPEGPTLFDFPVEASPPTADDRWSGTTDP
jgi:hypothetical protein